MKTKKQLINELYSIQIKIMLSKTFSPEHTNLINEKNRIFDELTDLVKDEK